MEGMSNVVWNMLMIRHSKERDERVMEAFRVGQVSLYSISMISCGKALKLTMHLITNLLEHLIENS